MFEHFLASSVVFQVAYVLLTELWKRIEGHRGCIAELPHVFNYKSEELRDPESGYWVVAYAEMAMKTIVFVLFDVYDTFRPRMLSRDSIQHIRSLDLPAVLSDQVNVDEDLRLLTVIYNTAFNWQPVRWTAHGTTPSLSPGSQGPRAYWLYYDPVGRRAISETTARAWSHARKIPVPDDSLM